MAAVSSVKPAHTWQQVLAAEVLGAVLDEDPASQGIKPTPENVEELSQRMLAWSFCVLDKEPEYLLKIQPVTPEKMAKLHLMAWHVGIQKVAKQLLQWHKVGYMCLIVEAQIQNLAKTKTAAKVTPDSKEKISTTSADDYEVVTVEPAPLSKLELAKQKCSLLQKWIKEPSLLRPDTHNFMAVELEAPSTST